MIGVDLAHHGLRQHPDSVGSEEQVHGASRRRQAAKEGARASRGAMVGQGAAEVSYSRVVRDPVPHVGVRPGPGGQWVVFKRRVHCSKPLRRFV